MDAVHYFTMLLVDRARRTGMPPERARKNAAHHGEHALYDFAFGDFRFQGIEQHFWQPFEVRYRLRRAGLARSGRSRRAASIRTWASASDQGKFGSCCGIRAPRSL